LAVLFADLNDDAGWLWSAPQYAGCGAAAVFVIVLLLGVRQPKSVELVIDRSGLAVNWDGRQARVPWQNVSHVGVLRPAPKTVNPMMKTLYAGNHALVYKLRPEVPAPPGSDAILSKELQRLGYYSIGTVGAFGATPAEVLTALDRFAGDRVLHTEREFLARDPQLRPGMI
jgi:hypothetical protein